MTGNRLPGDPSRAAFEARALRVDHAGEYGAQRIYQGQLALLGRGDAGDVLRHMQAQEQAHLESFTDMIGARGVRPTALLPLWHLAGYALGAATAALGTRAAMACTVAVEEAIDEHYRAQAAGLEDPVLRDTVERFRGEELEHRAIALAHEAEKAPGYRVLSSLIKGACKVAIKVSERI